MMQWGRPQPETVRDYRMEVREGAGWTEIVRVAGNYQRLRRHVLERPTMASALRVTVTATNGIDHARIFEVRAYS